MSSLGPPLNKIIEAPVQKYLLLEIDTNDLSKRIRTIIEFQSQNLPSQITFSNLMSKLVNNGLDLLNHNDSKDMSRFKIAGLVIFDCLLDVNDEVMPERRIEISNHICKVLENDKQPLASNETVLRTASLAIGHFARVATIGELEFLQNFYFPLSLKLIGDSRSDSHRFSGALILTQLAINLTALIYSKRKTLFNVIWDIVSDKSAMVRQAAAATLEASLQVISQRESMADYIRSALKQFELGFNSNTVEKIQGSLIILDTIVGGTIVTVSDLHNAIKLIGAQVQDIIWKVLQKKDWKDAEVKLKIIEIIPNLASAFSGSFLQPNNYTAPHNFLSFSIKHLTDVIHGKKDRAVAFTAMGKLFQALSSHFRTSPNVVDVFEVICSGLMDPFCIQALNCVGTIVNISTFARRLIDNKRIELIFNGGLSVELVENLKVIIKHVPTVRGCAQLYLRTHIIYALSSQTVCIDEVKNRPSSVRVVANSRESTAKSSIWNTGVFGTGKSESAVVHGQQNERSEQELLFALKVLTVPEFFPKQARDRNVTEEDQTVELLGIVRDYVVKYMDDFNPAIRKAAAQACASVLDVIVPGVDPDSNDFFLLYQILDRLLIMGVGDDSTEIRILVFKSITPSMDHALSLTDNVHCLIEALNDESLEVRAAAMTVLARVAHYDTLHVMPVVRLTLKRLIFTLNNTKDQLLKQESVQILQALVRGSDALIIPYVKQVIGPLMNLLNDQSEQVVVAALSTVGELAVASPASVREHLDELAPRLIEALNDSTSISKQETAVIAMGKLVSTLTMVTEEPYKRFIGLFEGLVKAVQNVEESSSELRLQAIKTIGLLGSVDTSVYQRHLASSNAVLGVFAAQTEAEMEDEEILDIDRFTPDEKKLSKIEKHYFSVVIRELMNVLKDSALSQYHQTAANLAMKTIRILGLQSLSQLDEVMEGILYRLHQVDAGSNIKDALLDHIITLIQILGKHMRKHSSQLIKLIQDFFESHTQLCLDIFESLGSAFLLADFTAILQGVLPILFQTIENESLAMPQVVSEDVTTTKTSTLKGSSVNSNKTLKILQKFVNMMDWLGEYRRDIIPLIMKLMDNPNSSIEIKREALCTVMQLSNESDLQEFAGRIIHALIRLLNTTDPMFSSAIITALSSLICRLGTGYIPYIIPVRRKLKTIPQLDNGMKIAKLEEYESLVSRLLKQRPLPGEPSDVSEISVRYDERVRYRATTIKAPYENSFQVNVQSLETAWALADQRNASNLVEWVNRLSIELIRQSPSPIIRSCATLIKSYRPLAAELFNASFHCIWDELFASLSSEVTIDNPLINGIEMALQSPQLPKNILTSLLNLAEFMDIQGKALPIDVRLLAQQTQAANMYAKCLRYREIEFGSKNVAPSIECVDALITIYNQLGLSDRAIGVLRFLRQEFPHIEIQPQWLEKLCRWDDAHKAYEVDIQHCKELYNDDSPVKHERWLKSELGRLRCLHALGEYEELESRAKKLREQIKVNDETSQELASLECVAEVQRLGANAAWMLGKWDIMEDFLEGEHKTSEIKDVVLEHNVTFFNAILAIQNQDFEKATNLINETRSSLSGSISSLLSESYSRAHRAMVTMQVLAEMEEVVEYKQLVEKIKVDIESLKTTGGDVKSIMMMSPMVESKSSGDKVSPMALDVASKKADLIRKWRARLKWVPKDVEVYRQILAVHTLVAEPMEDLESWLELVTLCRKEGMNSLCSNILRKLGAPITPKRLSSHLSLGPTMEHFLEPAVKTNEKVLFTTYQYWWSCGEKERALKELTSFLKAGSAADNHTNKDATMFRVKCLLKRAIWMRELEEGDVVEILENLREARDLAENDYSVWHAWAVANYDQLKRADSNDHKNAEEDNATVPLTFISPTSTNSRSMVRPAETPPSHQRINNRFSYLTPKKLNNNAGAASLLSFMSIQQADKVTPYVIEAIKGFVRSIILGQGQPVANLLQDTLRLITLWFSYGTKKGVFQILESELEKVSPDNWLSVVPQLIARIHIKSNEISALLRKLLIKVASAHPQPLVWPISVALNTNDNQQRMVASEVLSEMRKNRRQLVEEATLVSRELMRVAITPHELWYDGLEQAAQLYMDNKDISSMISMLRELHDTLSEQASVSHVRHEGFSEGFGKIGSTSLREVSFRHNYGKCLCDAQFWLDQYRSTGRTIDLHQAWEVYQSIFKKIKGQIGNLKRIELHHVSPSLTAAHNLSLAVPGTYRPSGRDICITSFSPTVHVIASKQRPRRMSMFGSNGQRYQFLLKGHEDLRQDERVMQLFGLINVCLNNERITNDRGLNIVRYSVLPLSNNSGVIGWVENCDTINQLVKQYREAKDIRLLIELKLLQSKCSNYDKLPLMHKVDVFQQVLDETSGDDLAKMLWLKSKSSDVWIERRANFTKSLAVMSVVGYILGLGDRHPSNLMLHQISGQVVHIDFGDCFEITAHRSKYPEIIPFRLTRMLTNCMQSAGSEGSYRLTSERVMRVLRDNRDSVMAMLEAFVYDPLISWRLLADSDSADVSRVNSTDDQHTKSPVDKVRDQLGASSLHATPSDLGATIEPPGDLSPKRAPMPSSSMRDVSGMRRSKSKDMGSTATDDEPHQNNLNSRALEVINRIQAKLTGRDFLKADDDEADDFTVEQQVDRLIKEATSIENLCQLFTGWCPLW